MPKSVSAAGDDATDKMAEHFYSPEARLDLLETWEFIARDKLSMLFALMVGLTIHTGKSEGGYRCTRALPPLTSASTSFNDAIEVSPGVVIANAPCAAPYSTAFCGSSNWSRP